MEQKIAQKVFCFYDNCNWIRNFKFSQSQKGYLSWAVNVLKNSPNISNFNKGDIFQVFLFRVIQKYDKSALMRISKVFGTN